MSTTLNPFFTFAMEYVGHQLDNIIQIIKSEHNMNNEDTSIYQTMCVQQDFTNGINAEFYKLDELALEVV